MSTTSNIDPEACWKLLGREMIRECNRMNNHFRCSAGQAHVIWLAKHTIVASTSEFPRLVIMKGAVKPAATGLASFATHFYPDKNTPPEQYILTIDGDMACSLSDTERRVPVREMCGRFFDVLCANSSDRRLLQSPCAH
jgi:hypothetical protein